VTKSGEKNKPAYEGRIKEEEQTSNLAIDGYRCRARVAYDGSGFNGFQVQTGKSKTRTIQGDLQDVLTKRFNQSIKVVGSGRTDTGVHARGQAIHFDIPNKLDDKEIKKLEYCMNCLLRRDIRVWDVHLAPRSRIIRDKESNGIIEHKWHAIADSKYKLYSYRFCKAHYLDPMERFYRSHFFEDFNVDKLKHLMKSFEGTHNFRAFAGAIEANEKKKGRTIGTIRTVKRVDFIDEDNDKYRIDIFLEGALYKMVRNMVGTALAVASNNMDEDLFYRLLNQPLNESSDTRIYRRDDNPAKPAPPEGLTLEQVFFDDF